MLRLQRLAPLAPGPSRRAAVSTQCLGRLPPPPRRRRPASRKTDYGTEGSWPG
uniref:Uncharacterized protein n=1 Tax=Arundo donax TaxID=35708 RepID=A0A0A9H968_ARUDO